MPNDLALDCRTTWRAVSDRPEAVIHGDLNHKNTLRCPDGLIALVDWDECRRDLVLFDLGPLCEGDEKEQRARG
ncbi:MAG: phosphotransferase [Ruegeria sp.]|uniref:phosphotransferase n=1 Tax=Ruegeria sp. TaxID=1879320 RepID=UPI00349E59C6